MNNGGKFSEMASALLLTAHGTVQLLDDADNVLWSSDDDDDFSDEFNDEFLEEADVEDILDYLVEADLLCEDDELDLQIDSLEDSEDVDLNNTRGV